MTEQTASRTLVKSPPELWAEVSDPGSLARHLGEFGEIRITRIEGESTVAWEGERASGTVEIAPSGWGTKVTLTARGPEPEPVPEPEPEPVQAPAPEPRTQPEPEPEPRRRGFFARLFNRRPPEPVSEEPVVEEPTVEQPALEAPAPEPEPDDTLAVLTAALDSLGTAHHRPFSRG